MAEQPDLIVVGMGVGGEEVAGTAAEAGMNVLAVERKLVGGECPYWGCIPSKIMVRAADTLAETGRVHRLAGTATAVPSWAPVADRIAGATTDWDDQIAVERFEGKGGTFLRGHARMVGRGAVEIDGTRYEPTRGVVLATGSEPAAPPIDGLADVDYWTNREAVEAKEVPRSMVVLGAGAVGLELAQVFARFAARVTLIEVAEHVLPTEEPENGAALEDTLRRDGMQVRTGVTARSVRRTDTGVAVELDDGTTVEAERLLVATGRRSDLGRLGVDAAGMDPDARSVAVDGRLRAADGAPGVWAVGDVTGKGAFTHVAVYQGRIAVADILGRDPAPADYSAVPRVTFTDPEVAGVGLTEAAAREAGYDVRVGVTQTASTARGFIHGPGAEDGVVKLVCDARNGVLVGGSVMDPRAGEVIGLLVLAVRQKVPVSALRELIYPYPTFVRGLEDALAQLA